MFRILWAFKLNPYERLNLPFDASLEDVRRQYRKISLMVHPDKCGHPQASTAFDCKCSASVHAGQQTLAMARNFRLMHMF